MLDRDSAKWQNIVRMLRAGRTILDISSAEHVGYSTIRAIRKAEGIEALPSGPRAGGKRLEVDLLGDYELVNNIYRRQNHQCLLCDDKIGTGNASLVGRPGDNLATFAACDRCLDLIGGLVSGGEWKGKIIEILAGLWAGFKTNTEPEILTSGTYNGEDVYKDSRGTYVLIDGQRSYVDAGKVKYPV